MNQTLRQSAKAANDEQYLTQSGWLRPWESTATENLCYFEPLLAKSLRSNKVNRVRVFFHSNDARKNISGLTSKARESRNFNQLFCSVATPQTSALCGGSLHTYINPTTTTSHTHSVYLVLFHFTYISYTILMFFFWKVAQKKRIVRKKKCETITFQCKTIELQLRSKDKTYCVDH